MENIICGVMISKGKIINETISEKEKKNAAVRRMNFIVLIAEEGRTDVFNYS